VCYRSTFIVAPQNIVAQRGAHILQQGRNSEVVCAAVEHRSRVVGAWRRGVGAKGRRGVRGLSGDRGFSKSGAGSFMKIRTKCYPTSIFCPPWEPQPLASARLFGLHCMPNSQPVSRPGQGFVRCQAKLEKNSERCQPNKTPRVASTGELSPVRRDGAGNTHQSPKSDPAVELCARPFALSCYLF
jgi:hypothetical protein